MNLFVIPAGSNDPTSPPLAGNLRPGRAAKVARLLPRHRRVAATVRSVGLALGDKCIDLRRLGTNVGVLPDSYRALVRLAPTACS